MSRCHEFPGYELVDTFCSGWSGGEGCGFLVVDHGVSADGADGLRNPEEGVGDGEEEDGKSKGKQQKENRVRDTKGRIIVAFRGTYSLANTIADLRSVKQDYVRYPGDEAALAPVDNYASSLPDDDKSTDYSNLLPPITTTQDRPKCTNCTVHSGFHDTYLAMRPLLLKYLTTLRYKYPDYDLHLVGHSLGGAVAALAGLEYDSFGWKPTITTFGEPMVGNWEFNEWLDGIFGLNDDGGGREKGSGTRDGTRYRRVTHKGDPVPLLPLREWGYYPHAGEIYIEKEQLQPDITDLRLCNGDADPACMASEDDNPSSASFLQSEEFEKWVKDVGQKVMHGASERDMEEVETQMRSRWGHLLPKRFRLWQLFFAHRDYFWRLGLCVPGGDPGGDFGWGGWRGGREGSGRVEEL